MIKTNLRVITDKIIVACEKSGRDPNSVRVLAVSKNFKAETILEAKALGISYFGENRVQEARDKVKAKLFDGTKLSLIGHLQTNKASLAARIFDEVHSVDSKKIAEALSKFSMRYRKEALPVYIQVNIGENGSKHGCMPEVSFDLAKRILELEGLNLVGLMAVAPLGDEPRRHFRNLRLLRDEIRAKGIPARNSAQLSMGMSSDYLTAIEEGATVVRIGRALFGPRLYQ